MMKKHADVKVNLDSLDVQMTENHTNEINLQIKLK